jgi:prepilin-type N-terminal cleavage/methylation domain-containing protein
MRIARYESQATNSGPRATRQGFTLVELLIALIVTSIILTAVATLAFALSSANDSTDDTSYKQAQIRIATLRISDLIRHSRLICASSDSDIAVWRADDNGDGQINISELIYIEKGSGSDHLRLYEFPQPVSDPHIELNIIQAFSTNWWSAYVSEATDMMLIPQCSNVQFQFLFDELGDPVTKSRFVCISFDLFESNIVRQYQISAALRCWADNLLNEDGTAIVSDDD